MPEAKPATQADDAEEATDDAGPLDVGALKEQGDVQALLALAKACRAGTAPGGRDLKRCLEAYRAAAELGSADAEYAVALFCMSGGVVTQDLKEGATRLRAAAEKGSVPAKVYLGNLYELGIHYKADAEKADVWYRNAARGAGIEGDPTADETILELAELGCARWVVKLTEGGSLDADQKTRLLQRARAHGYGLRLKDEAAVDRPTFLNALEDAEATKAPAPGTERDPIPSERASDATPKKATASSSTTAVGKEKKAEASRAASPKKTNGGAAAFGYALLFVMTGIGAGYAAALGARELVAHGHVLPGLGTKTHLVFPIVLGVVGVLPTCLVYRLGAVLKAIVAGAAFAGVGWVAWGTGQAVLHADRPVQALAFGIAGFLPALLVLGLIGGAKQKAPRARRHLSG